MYVEVYSPDASSSNLSMPHWKLRIGQLATVRTISYTIFTRAQNKRFQTLGYFILDQLYFRLATTLEAKAVLLGHLGVLLGNWPMTSC